MARRNKINNHYVMRGRDGEFLEWNSIGMSSWIDSRFKAKHKARKGYKHQGD